MFSYQRRFQRKADDSLDYKFEYEDDDAYFESSSGDSGFNDQDDDDYGDNDYNDANLDGNYVNPIIRIAVKLLDFPWNQDLGNQNSELFRRVAQNLTSNIKNIYANYKGSYTETLKNRNLPYVMTACRSRKGGKAKHF